MAMLQDTDVNGGDVHDPVGGCATVCISVKVWACDRIPGAKVTRNEASIIKSVRIKFAPAQLNSPVKFVC
jgi:hypothetical protein